MLEPLARAALLEDLGRAGDLTTDAIVPADARAATVLRTRQDGVVAGLDLAALAFRLIEPSIEIAYARRDGDKVGAGETIATLQGPARGILTGERTALNFLSRLSGIASATASIVASVEGSKARICCTRKTTPGLRAIEKYAVRAGGGANHRFGLDDAVLIKDNHVAIAGGIRAAVERARAGIGHLSGSSSKSTRSTSSPRRSRSASTPSCSTICRSINCARPLRWSRAARSRRRQGASRRPPRRRSRRRASI
jgi:nicotinate-nucleotide pyrophosphorylase (carboxylating)